MNDNVGTPNVNLGGFEKVANSSNLNPSYSAGGGFADASMAFLKSGEALQKATEAGIKGYEDYILKPKIKKEYNKKKEAIQKEIDENLKAQKLEAEDEVKKSARNIYPVEEDDSFSRDRQYRSMLDEEELKLIPILAQQNGTSEEAVVKALADKKIDQIGDKILGLDGDTLLKNKDIIAKQYGPQISSYYNISNEEAEIKTQKIVNDLGFQKKVTEIDSNLQKAQNERQQISDTLSQFIFIDSNNPNQINQARQFVNTALAYDTNRKQFAEAYGLKVIDLGNGQYDYTPETKKLLNDLNVLISADDAYQNEIINGTQYREQLTNYMDTLDNYERSLLDEQYQKDKATFSPMNNIDRATVASKSQEINMSYRQDKSAMGIEQLQAELAEKLGITTEELNKRLMQQGQQQGQQQIDQNLNANGNKNNTSDNKIDNSHNKIDNSQIVEDIKSKDLQSMSEADIDSFLRDSLFVTSTQYSDDNSKTISLSEKKLDSSNIEKITQFYNSLPSDQQKYFLKKFSENIAGGKFNPENVQQVYNIFNEAQFKPNKDGVYNVGDISFKENKKDNTLTINNGLETKTIKNNVEVAVIRSTDKDGHQSFTINLDQLDKETEKKVLSAILGERFVNKIYQENNTNDKSKVIEYLKTERYYIDNNGNVNKAFVENNLLKSTSYTDKELINIINSKAGGDLFNVKEIPATYKDYAAYIAKSVLDQQHQKTLNPYTIYQIAALGIMINEGISPNSILGDKVKSASNTQIIELSDGIQNKLKEGQMAIWGIKDFDEKEKIIYFDTEIIKSGPEEMRFFIQDLDHTVNRSKGITNNGTTIQISMKDILLHQNSKPIYEDALQYRLMEEKKILEQKKQREAIEKSKMNIHPIDMTRMYMNDNAMEIYGVSGKSK